MKKQDIINKARFYLHDENKEIWSDEELSFFADEAAKQYSADTGIYCGTFDIVPDADGNFRYPADYIHFITGWNSEGTSVNAASVRDIWDFDRKGEIECIYDDASSEGMYNIYPERTITVRYDIAKDDYGVFYHGYGLLENPFEYGLVYAVKGYEFAGNIIYCRIADAEDIQDYTALIYKILELAHCTESEFADSSMAQLFRNNYNSRTASFRQNKHKTAGYYSVGTFY